MGFQGRLILGSTMMALAACAAVEERTEERKPREPQEAREVVPRSSGQTYYRVTRQDFRKCAYPMCGGVYVAEVNRSESMCADGQNAPDCYVSDIDLSALGLDPEKASEIGNLAKMGGVLLRGDLVFNDAPHASIPKFSAGAAWRGATQTPHTDPTYLVVDNGIVCITFPCFSMSQLTLNVGTTDTKSGLSLEASGASQADLDAAYSQLASPGLIVSGTHVIETGPAGQGEALVASEIYLPVTGAVACGDSICGAGDYCCNPSCGMCAPLGGVCTQQACNPCAHDTCDEGEALDASCSSCSTVVCNADPFCCDNSWDSLCVKEATQLCNACEEEPPPPPSCAHSECDDGGKLALGCSPCANDVCAQDAFCCNTAWDDLCVKQAAELCESCAVEPPSCAHSECQAGGVLDIGCSSCATEVCDADAYCCDTAWDSLCVDEAESWCDDACGS